MRRIALLALPLVALALPAVAAAALSASPGDGTLVVRNADNGDGADPSARPVVTVVIHGSIVGQVGGQGRISISSLGPPSGASDYSVTSTGGSVVWHRDVSDIATVWGGNGFRFRAVAGYYRVVIRGSDVDLFAIGSGTVSLTGQPGTQQDDGEYSVNGGDFRSIPLSLDRTIGTPSGS